MDVKFRTLAGEIAKKGIRKIDVAKTAGCSYRSLHSKMIGATEFTWNEVVAIKQTYFPDMSIEQLFRDDAGNNVRT